jgi:hypothetical protein
MTRFSARQSGIPSTVRLHERIEKLGFHGAVEIAVEVGCVVENLDIPGQCRTPFDERALVDRNGPAALSGNDRSVEHDR